MNTEWEAVAERPGRPFRSHRWYSTTLYRDGCEVCHFPEPEAGEEEAQHRLIAYMVDSLNAAAEEERYVLAPTQEECA